MTKRSKVAGARQRPVAFAQQNFEIPFEETVRRYQTRVQCEEFGEEALKRWWKGKDDSDICVKAVLQKIRIEKALSGKYMMRLWEIKDKNYGSGRKWNKMR